MSSFDDNVTRWLSCIKTDRFVYNEYDDMVEEIEKKKLIVYGVVGILRYLHLHCDSPIEISYAIDNDKKKQGFYINDLYGGNFKNGNEVKIVSSDILKTLNPNEYVVLITAARSLDQIEYELNNLGFNYCLSLIYMEYNYRRNAKRNHMHILKDNDYVDKYVSWTIQKNPIKNNKIVMWGQGYFSDHEKYIAKALNVAENDLDIVFFVRDENVNVPSFIRPVCVNKWWQYVYELETAKIWISDGTFPVFIKKREGQVFIETKHWGSITLKKFYLDDKSPNVKDCFIDEYILNGKWMDYIITGSEFDEESCRRGFHFKGKFLRFGSPRSDAMFHPNDCKKRVCEKYNISMDTHFLIYAPTYRFMTKENRKFDVMWQDLNFELLHNALEKRWGGSWIILLRLHPEIRKQSGSIPIPSYVIDASNYDDGVELVSSADVMISDFSSIMFEPAYVKKPVFLYAPDKDSYVSNNYELLIDYDTLPFPIAKSNKELVAEIERFDDEDYSRKLEFFLNKYGVNEDGGASKRVADFISELIHGKYEM